MWIDEKEAEKVDIKPIKRKSQAKTFRGFLNGLLQKARNDNNKELEIMFNEILKKFNEFYPLQIVKIQILEGWEGKGDYPVWKDVNNDFLVEIWHKNDKQLYKVPKEHLNAMLRVVRQLEIGVEYKCYAIAKKLGYEWKELWKERTDLYFPLYYIPLKCLDKLGVIQYGGNKKFIKRLK